MFLETDQRTKGQKSPAGGLYAQAIFFHPSARHWLNGRNGGTHPDTTSPTNAARTRSGSGVGRRVARSTQTWTKCPVAAGSSSPRRNNPTSYRTEVFPSFATRSPASTTSGNDSGL